MLQHELHHLVERGALEGRAGTGREDALGADDETEGGIPRVAKGGGDAVSMQGAGQAKRSRKAGLTLGNDGDRGPPRRSITEAQGKKVGIEGENRTRSRARQDQLAGSDHPGPRVHLRREAPR